MYFCSGEPKHFCSGVDTLQVGTAFLDPEFGDVTYKKGDSFFASVV